MLQSEAIVTKRRKRAGTKPAPAAGSTAALRYSVGLAPDLARQVEKYAQAVHSSRSKAIASLVRHGLQSQEQRKRESDNGDPKEQDRLVDDFRALILGR